MDTARQILVFTLGRNQYAMDILHLFEVGRMPRLEETPGAPPLVLGIARLHGRPVRVYNLAGLVGEETAAPPDDEKGAGRHPWMIVSRCGDGERHWWVDTVHDIIDYDPESVSREGEGEEEGESIVPGVLEVDDRLTYVLTPTLLDNRETALQEQAGKGSAWEEGADGPDVRQGSASGTETG